ncbi:hypothetical protein GCM10027605_68340 [Micromonospora zhanjiangensis]
MLGQFRPGDRFGHIPPTEWARSGRNSLLLLPPPSFAARRRRGCGGNAGDGGTVMPVTVKKIFAWLGVGFLFFFMAFRPDGAAQIFKAIGGVLMAVAQGLGDFLTSLMT